MVSTDAYIELIQRKGDEFSQIVRALTAPTLRNIPRGLSQSLIEVLDDGMGGVAVVRAPGDDLIYVQSEVGNPLLQDPHEHAASLVDRLACGARSIGAIPIAFGNVIDASEFSSTLAHSIGTGLLEGANRNGVAVLNGESAGLGVRVVGAANIMGTMVSIKPKSSSLERLPQGVARFDPKGLSVWINSDGGGTVFEFYERAAELNLEPGFFRSLNDYGIGDVFGMSLFDPAAMLLDDTARQAATAKVLSVAVESNRPMSLGPLRDAAARIGGYNLVDYVLSPHIAPNRWRGWSDAAFAYNISGSSVSVIDENRLRNPPRAKVGDTLIAVQSPMTNRRSNGISDLRRAAKLLHGEEWHRTEEGRKLLEYLLRPSTIFYTAFMELLSSGAANAVYHMSGGALESKLAKPLAKEDQYVAVENLFHPPKAHKILAKAIGTNEYDARRKWPYGTEAYVVAEIPQWAEEILRNEGFVTRRVGTIQHAKDGRTGVEVKDRFVDNKPLYYSGKAA